METKPEVLYLDLMKKTLSYMLWEEPGMPIELFAYRKSFLQRIMTLSLSKFLRIFNYQAVKKHILENDSREEGRVWPRYADTMIGLKRLNNIQFCAENVIKNKIDGDFIETGVWRGGGTIFMRAILAAYGVTDRRVFVADSFEGLPAPDDDKYPQDKGDTHYMEQFLAVSQEKVAENFKRYDLLDDQVVFLKGWFKDSLPNAPIEKLALLRIDGDMYESTQDAITNLYPKLTEGGYCIIDDYVHPACKLAVDEYREKNNITSPMEKIDWTGVYWKK